MALSGRVARRTGVELGPNISPLQVADDLLENRQLTQQFRASIDDSESLLDPEPIMSTHDLGGWHNYHVFTPPGTCHESVMLEQECHAVYEQRLSRRTS